MSDTPAAEPTVEPRPKRRPGRPRGAKTRQRDTVNGAMTRCRACGSTERTPYHHRRVIEFGGETADGPYTHIIIRSTECKTCGQARVDRTFENRRN